MATLDVPAIIETILRETKQKKLYAVGQSMGTTIMFSLLSETNAFDKTVGLRTCDFDEAVAMDFSYGIRI